jgi:hypothetical protein
MPSQRSSRLASHRWGGVLRRVLRGRGGGSIVENEDAIRLRQLEETDPYTPHPQSEHETLEKAAQTPPSTVGELSAQEHAPLVCAPEVEVHAAEPSGGPETTDVLDLPDLEDEFLEQAAETDLLRRTGAPERRLLEHLARVTDNLAEAQRFRGIDTIEFLGPLVDGLWGWVGDSGTWGVVDGGAPELGGLSPQHGDVLRARIEGWPWAYRIEVIAPTTLRRDGKRLSPLPRSLSDHRSGWRGLLERGDLIVARVPFSPHSLPSSSGAMSKVRPAVFMGWSGDAALVRGIYTYTRDRYVSRNRSIQLLPEADLDRASIAVRDRSVEIPAEWIDRRIGTLSEGNRGRIGIGGQRSPVEESRPTALVPTPPSEVQSYLEELLREAPPTQWTDAIRQVLSDISSLRLFSERLRNGGVALSEVGSLLAALEAMHPQLGSRPAGLRSMVSELLPNDPQLTLLALAKSHHAVPADLLVLAGSTSQSPTTRPPSPMMAVEATSFEVSWEGEPAVVIYDQSWSHGHLRNRRVDLRLLRESLACDADPPFYLVGPCLEEVATFHNVARHTGWTVECASCREAELETARRLARDADDGPVVVVTSAADMVRELEDDGHDVYIVSDLRPFELR